MSQIWLKLLVVFIIASQFIDAGQVLYGSVSADASLPYDQDDSTDPSPESNYNMDEARQDGVNVLGKKILNKYPQGLKSVVIAPGSLGDVLPLLQFAMKMNKKLPWINISRIATLDSSNVNVLVRQLSNLDTSPLYFDECYTEKEWKNYMDCRVNYEQDQETRQPVQKMSQYSAIFTSFVRGLNEVIGDADVIFYWNFDRKFNLHYSHFAKRVKGFGGKALIELMPSFSQQSNYLAAANSLYAQRQNDNVDAVDAVNEILQWRNVSSVNQLGKVQKRKLFNYAGVLGQLSHRFAKNNQFYDAAYGDIVRQRIPTFVMQSTLFVPSFVQQSSFDFIGTSQLEIDAQYQLPTGLKNFINNIERDNLIYVGLGSASECDDTKQFDRKMCGVIGILSKKLSSLKIIWQIGRSGELTPTYLDGLDCMRNTFVLNEFVPHAALFPKVKVVVHHGGAGTSQAALLYVAVQVVVPQMNNDQAYFSAMVNNLTIGVGLNYVYTDTELYYAVLKAHESTEMQDNVSEKQAKMQEELASPETEFAVAQTIQDQLVTKRSMSQRTFYRHNSQPCVRSGQKFILKQGNRNCRLAAGKIVCDFDKKPTWFSFEADKLLQAEPPEVAVDGSVLLAAHVGRSKLYIVPKYQSVLGYKAVANSIDAELLDMVRMAPTEMQKDEFDYCVRQNDKVLIMFGNLDSGFKRMFSLNDVGVLKLVSEAEGDEFTLQF